jgi:hypothetical protein
MIDQGLLWTAPAASAWAYRSLNSTLKLLYLATRVAAA